LFNNRFLSLGGFLNLGRLFNDDRCSFLSLCLFLLGRFGLGRFSFGRFSLGRLFLGRFLLGRFSFGRFSLGRFFLGRVLGRFFLGRFLLGRFSFGRFSLGRLLLGRVLGWINLGRWFDLSLGLDLVLNLSYNRFSDLYLGILSLYLFDNSNDFFNFRLFNLGFFSLYLDLFLIDSFNYSWLLDLSLGLFLSSLWFFDDWLFHFLGWFGFRFLNDDSGLFYLLLRLSNLLDNSLGNGFLNWIVEYLLGRFFVDACLMNWPIIFSLFLKILGRSDLLNDHFFFNLGLLWGSDWSAEVVFRLLFFLHFDLLDNLCNIGGSAGFHGVLEVVGLLSEFLVLVSNLLVFARDDVTILLFEVYTDFVVDEREDHAVVEGDQVWGLVFGHLSVGLHKDESTVGGELVFSFFADGPALSIVVRDGAVVSGDSLEFDLDFALGRATNWEEMLAVSFKQDFLLNVVLGLITADPGGASTQCWGLLRSILLDSVIVVREEHLEVLGGGNRGSLGVGDFVEVVVDNLTKVDEHILLNLNFSVLVDLYSGSVNDTQITHKVLSVLAHNHELRFPEFLVVGDLVVIGVTFTDLEDTRAAIKSDAETLDLFGVNSLEL
jgi:hypothetical protein